MLAQGLALSERPALAAPLDKLWFWQSLQKLVIHCRSSLASLPVRLGKLAALKATSTAFWQLRPRQIHASIEKLSWRLQACIQK